MIRKTSAIAIAIALTSCGSSTGTPEIPVVSSPSPSPSSPTPSPSPSPTPSPSSPTPSPSPSPSPSGGTFATLHGIVTLQSTNSGFTTAIGAPSVFGINAFGEGVRFIYDPDGRGIQVDNGPNSPSFVAGDIAQSSPDFTRWVKSNGYALTLTRPTGVAEDYVRFIDYSDVGTRARVLAVTGIPTLSSDVPTSGSVTFTRTLVAGTAYLTTTNPANPTELVLSKSTLSLTIDFSRQIVTTRLVLVGTPLGGGTDIAIGTVSGTVTFSGVSSGLTYSSTNFVNSDQLIASGALFGPQGREVGLLASFVFRGSGGLVQGVALGAGGR